MPEVVVGERRHFRAGEQVDLVQRLAQPARRQVARVGRFVLGGPALELVARNAGLRQIVVRSPRLRPRRGRDGIGGADAFRLLSGGPGYDPGDFVDLTHLARSGAEKLTRQVLAAARAAAAPPP